MLFMNEFDIERAVAQHRNHPVLGKATATLKAFMDTVNANSDGWPYWSAAPRSAKKLMELIQLGDELAMDRLWGDKRTAAEAAITEVALKKALVPIKALCTRHGLAFPRIS